MLYVGSTFMVICRDVMLTIIGLLFSFFSSALEQLHPPIRHLIDTDDINARSICKPSLLCLKPTYHHSSFRSLTCHQLFHFLSPCFGPPSRLSIHDNGRLVRTWRLDEIVPGPCDIRGCPTTTTTIVPVSPTIARSTQTSES